MRDLERDPDDVKHDINEPTILHRPYAYNSWNKEMKITEIEDSLRNIYIKNKISEVYDIERGLTSHFTDLIFTILSEIQYPESMGLNFDGPK